MKSKIVWHIIVVLFLVVSAVSAHPGKMDGNGGHTCRTNCEKWGLKDGEYHYHTSPIQSSTPPPVPTVTTTRTPEPTITSTPTPEPTITPTRTPEPTITSTPTPEPTITPTRTLEPMVTPTRTPTPEPTEDRFVDYSAVKSTDTQNQVIDSLNKTEKKINQKENSKNWFERIITWLFKYNN